MMASDFMDDTGHQIPVEFKDESLTVRVFSYVRNLVNYRSE